MNLKRYSNWTWTAQEYPLGAIVIGGRVIPSQDVEAPPDGFHVFVFSADGRIFVLWHAETEDQPEYQLVIVDEDGNLDDVEIPVTSSQYRRMGLQRPPESFDEAAAVVEVILSHTR